MRIAIVGASGLVGRPVADLLEAEGHEVRRLHRSSSAYPVDLSTGAGLPAAMDGVEAVVNAANQPPPKKPGPVLIEGTRRLLDAAPQAHHVLVSIVGIDRTGAASGYYGAKLEQEAVLTGAGRPYSIVRATQFHEFLGGYMLTLARYRVQARGRARFQPVSVGEVASAVAARAVAAPSGAITTVAGPEVLTLSQLRAGPGLPIPIPIIGTFGRELRAGALTDPNPDVRGVVTYAQWLAGARS